MFNKFLRTSVTIDGGGLDKGSRMLRKSLMFCLIVGTHLMINGCINHSNANTEPFITDLARDTTTEKSKVIRGRRKIRTYSDDLIPPEYARTAESFLQIHPSSPDHDAIYKAALGAGTKFKIWQDRNYWGCALGIVGGLLSGGSGVSQYLIEDPKSETARICTTIGGVIGLVSAGFSAYATKQMKFLSEAQKEYEVFIGKMSSEVLTKQPPPSSVEVNGNNFTMWVRKYYHAKYNENL